MLCRSHARIGRPSAGNSTPMEVMDAPFRAGDLLHGYQAVADNLPNDPRIHEAKGTKKIFFKNFMDARVNYVILPLAKYVMPEAQAARASGEGYMAAIVLHEISHGLGPAYCAREREAGAHHGGDRSGVFGARGSQSGCDRNVRVAMADGSWRAAEKSRAKNTTHRTSREFSALCATGPLKRTAARR